MNVRQRVAVALLAVSAAGFGAWVQHEGDGPIVVAPDGTELHAPYIPAKGDVPTIGHGSTHYEDGTRVKLTDKPIPRARADQLARNLMSVDERRFADSLPGVKLFQGEFDLYMDFTGQYGIGSWRKPKSPRTWLLRGDYVGACAALLNWRFLNGYDCSTTINGRRNKVCWGVWTRQLERHEQCRSFQ